MPGVPRLDFDFTGLAAKSAITRMPLVQTLDVADWGGCVAALRVHAANLGTGTSFRVEVVAVSPDPEDPAPFFRGPVVACFEVAAGQLSAPSLLVAPLSRYSGAQVGVFLSVTQGDPAAALSFTISLELTPLEGTDRWTPAELGSKLTLWLDQRDQVVVSGAVSDWGDQSAAGNDFTMAISAGRRPAAGTQLNFLDAPDFDGVDDILDLASAGPSSLLISASAYHLFSVVRFDSITRNQPNPYDNHIVFGDAGAFFALVVGTPGVQAYQWDGTGIRATPAIPVVTGQSYLIEQSFDGTTLRCRVGSGPVQTNTSGNISNLTLVPRLGFGWGLSGYLDGPIGSMVVSNTYLSAAEATNVRAYLSSLYGVPA